MAKCRTWRRTSARNRPRTPRACASRSSRTSRQAGRRCVRCSRRRGRCTRRSPRRFGAPAGSRAHRLDRSRPCERTCWRRNRRRRGCRRRRRSRRIRWRHAVVVDAVAGVGGAGKDRHAPVVAVAAVRGEAARGAPVTGDAVRSPNWSPSASGHSETARPSSMAPSQSSSTALQTSARSGWTPRRVSSQSVPHARAPPRPPLQQAASAWSSPSASRTPNVAGSQSSSCAFTSHTSTRPGARFESLSSQSSPPHSVDSWPSPSASGRSHPHRLVASSHVMPSMHGATPGTQPRASADVEDGSQRSKPLQNLPSSQSAETVHATAPSIELASSTREGSAQPEKSTIDATRAHPRMVGTIPRDGKRERRPPLGDRRPVRSQRGLRPGTSSRRRRRRGRGCAGARPWRSGPGARRPGRGGATRARCTARGPSRRAGGPCSGGRRSGS